MPKPVKAGPKMVPAKGTWLTPTQLSEGLMYEWKKLERLGLDSKGISKAVDVSAPTSNLEDTSAYDSFFHIKQDFNPKVGREDRADPSIIWRRIYHEERKRTIPLRTSSEYGRSSIKFNVRSIFDYRRARVMDQLYRRFNINMKHGKKLPVPPREPL